MVDISATQVKELREKSGAAMMDCKKALVETQGDFDKAFEWLRQKGVAVANKKATRAAQEGLVIGVVSDNGKAGVLLEVNCETDFVARNEEFVKLGKELADIALKTKSTSADALMKQKHGAGTVADYVTAAVAKTGENIQVKRLDYLELSEPGVIGLYVHALGGKMGALLKITSNKELSKAEGEALGRELAMHVVSAKPQFISRNEVPKNVIEEEQRIESGKADLADKKPEIREKIVTGRVDKLLAERCFLEQPFVKDPSQTIQQVFTAKGKEMQAELKPVKFALYILGENSETSNNGSN